MGKELSLFYSSLTEVTCQKWMTPAPVEFIFYRPFKCFILVIVYGVLVMGERQIDYIPSVSSCIYLLLLNFKQILIYFNKMFSNLISLV